MKRFLGFVWKEFLHIFRDYRTMLILFGIPVAQIMLFGYVITNELKDIRIAVLDHSKDEVTREITRKILSSGFFILDRTLDSAGQMEEVFREGKVKEVVVFPPGFAENMQRLPGVDIQLIADASDANTAQLVVNYTSAIIQNYLQNRISETSLPVKVNAGVRMFYNPSLKGVYMFVPGIMAMILVLISALMTSVSIAREKEFGTMEVLLVSPLRPSQIILGKVTPYMALSVINAVSIILLGNLVFGVPVQGSTVLLLAVSILYIFLALTIGIFISTLARTQQMAMFMSLFIMMLPTILLSGFIFPIENMPKILQWFSALMPPRWFIVVIKSIMLKANGLLYVWKEVLILAGMSLLFLVMSFVRFRVRLE
ncbi:MAG TPA: ABC transporter permease [Bacteroidetes bacterium]|nr:ABC transporter permease [Bacteroidota bacterium]